MFSRRQPEPSERYIFESVAVAEFGRQGFGIGVVDEDVAGRGDIGVMVEAPACYGMATGDVFVREGGCKLVTMCSQPGTEG